MIRIVERLITISPFGPALSGVCHYPGRMSILSQNIKSKVHALAEHFLERPVSLDQAEDELGKKVS